MTPDDAAARAGFEASGATSPGMPTPHSSFAM